MFKRTFTVDENYMFTIHQTVENRGADPVSLLPYSSITWYGMPLTSGFFILYEGPLGVFNGTLDEVSYEDVQEKGVVYRQTTGGWIGITDKYWQSIVIPDQKQAITARFVHQRAQDRDQFQVDFVGQQQTLAPGALIESESRLFAGAKVVTLIDHYEGKVRDRKVLSIDRLGLVSISYTAGVLFPELLARSSRQFRCRHPASHRGDKAGFFPLANKSYKAMSQMRKLQPEMMRLKERFGDDRVRLNQEMMALYKREKVNPASGCLPIIVQISGILRASTAMLCHHRDAARAFLRLDPRPVGARSDIGVQLVRPIPWNPPLFLMLALAVDHGRDDTQQKLNPQPPDPIQAKMFAILPVVFTFMLAHFPAGLVIYWTLEQHPLDHPAVGIMRRMGVKI